MRIGIDLRTLLDAQYSGVSEFTWRLVTEVLKQDTKNEYALFANSWHDPAKKIPVFSSQAEIKYTRYPNKIFNYLLQKSLHFPKIDRLLGVDLFFMPHINFISLSKTVQKVITVHDLSFLKYPEFFSWRKNFWHAMINVRNLLPQFDMIMAVSQSTKQDIVDLCHINPEKIRVVYPGISPEIKKMEARSPVALRVKEKYNLPDEYILFLGNIEPRKNVGGLIAAFEHLKGKFANLHLILAGGRGWKADPIYRTWQQSKWKKDIIFLDYVDKDDKSALYSLAKVFAYPSFYEGFGFPPLEAMACSCPVVAGSSSSLGEAVGDAAILVNPRNIQEIAAGIAAVLSDQSLRARLVEAGLYHIAGFSWENAPVATWIAFKIWHRLFKSDLLR